MKKYLKFSIATSLLFTAVCLSAQISFTNFTTVNGLIDNFVSGGVAVDNNNVKWFGTQSGLSKFDGTVWTTYTAADGLIDNYVQCVASDNAGNVWIGTGNGVSKFNGSTWSTYTTEQGLPDNSVNYIAIDNSGNVWFATYSGLAKFDGTNFTTFTTSDGLSSDLITYILPVGSKIWLGTIGGGLACYDGSTFTSITTTNGLPDNNTGAIELDANGKIWVGTYHGLAVINTSNVVETVYTLDNGLFNNYVQDIVIDSDGNVIVLEFADYLSDGGVTVFNGTSWHTYVVTDGLVDVLVKRAEIDEDGFVWITTGAGISKMSLGSAVEQFSLLQADVYPNPADNQIFITGLQTDVDIEFYDICGKLSLSGTTISGKISCEELPTGIYFLRFRSGNEEYVARILKN